MSSRSFFVIGALIEGKSMYICSEEKNRQKAAIVIKLMTIIVENLLLKKIAILRIVDLADVGKGKTLKLKSSQEV